MRFNKTGETVNARPCIECLHMMKDIGINKVYYSTGKDDGMVCESIKHMISLQISSVTRKILICGNYNEYFENMMKTTFPKYVNYNNLIYFIEYNFKNILPECSYYIENKIVIFYNKNNDHLARSIIINQ